MWVNLKETSASQDGLAPRLHLHYSYNTALPLLTESFSFSNPFPVSLLHFHFLLARPATLGPTSFPLPPYMATKLQTEQLYDGNQSVGVAVSPLFPIFFLKYVLTMSHLPARCSLPAVCSR